MIDVTNIWLNKLDFFTSFSTDQQQKDSTVTSVALNKISQTTDDKKDIINQTVSVWQSWKNGDTELIGKALAIFLSLHEEYLGKDTPLEPLDEIMSEWQNDPILLTKVARNLEKNNPSLFKDLLDKKLIFSVRVDEEDETRWYSKALLEKNAPYLFRMIHFPGAEHDPNTGTVMLPDNKIFNYILENLESSLVEDPSERKKEQMAKASAFITNSGSVDGLISDIFEYNLVAVEDALVKLVGDLNLASRNPQIKVPKFLQQIVSSQSLLMAPAAELKKRIKILHKTLILLRNMPCYDLILSSIIVRNRKDLDKVIKYILAIIGTGYSLRIKEFIISDIKGLTFLNLSSIPKSTVTSYSLSDLNSLEAIYLGQAEHVKIRYCKQLKTIYGTANTWDFNGLDALRIVEIS